MLDDELVAKINELPKWQQKIKFNENVNSPGDWDPNLQFKLFKECLPSLKGKRVLDVGANGGGLSFLLRDAGANVVAAEPYEIHRKQIDLYMKYKGINDIDVVENDIFSIHELGEFDIIFCLGLLYHFRHPQYILDYIASFHKGAIFLSSQTIKGSDLIMKNRRQYDKSPEANQKPLSGWEPTIPLLERMISGAGFKNFQCLQSAHAPGFTNSAYYYIPADANRECDVKSLCDKFM